MSENIYVMTCFDLPLAIIILYYAARLVKAYLRGYKA